MTPEQIEKMRPGFEKLMTGARFRHPLEDLKFDPETQCYDNHEMQIRFICWCESRQALGEEIMAKVNAQRDRMAAHDAEG